MKWMIAWMAHAVSNGLNPFFTPLIGGPSGVSLYWSTTVPLPALVATPLTLLIGAQASYNALVVVALTVSVWSVYLLCREVTGRHWPSVVGGTLFLLSPYMVKEVMHLNLLSVAPVVLLARTTIRFGKASISTRKFVLQGAVLLIAQFFSSTEIFATSALFGGLAIGLHLLSMREGRLALAKRLALGLGLAYAACVAFVSPFLVRAWALRPSALGFPSEDRAVELLELFIPSGNTLLGAWTTGIRDAAGIETVGPTGGTQGYLGLPIVILLALMWRRRDIYPRWLPWFISLVMLLSLGSQAVIFRDLAVPGPTLFLAALPLIQHAWPVRFPLYAWVALSVAFALYAASRPSGPPWRRSLWIGVTFVFLIPSAGLLPPVDDLWPAYRPSFFALSTHRWFLRSDDVVLALGPGPTGSEMEWQMASNFGFRLAEGSLGPYAPWGTPPLNMTSEPPADVGEMRLLVEQLAIDWVVLPQFDLGASGIWRRLLQKVEVEPPLSVGGVVLYRVRPATARGSEPPSIAAQIAYRRGIAALSDGAKSLATEEFLNVLLTRPTHRFAHYQLAMLALDKADESDKARAAAEVHLRAALVENPAFVWPLVELARLMTKEGRSVDAAAFYQRAFDLRPSALTFEELTWIVGSGT